MNDGPRVERIRHELKRRKLTVARVERYSPQMVRVVLTGDELDGFTSLGFDDHVKLFFGEGAMRDFTPRHFDAWARELWIDFFLHAPGAHEAGPAATWASQVAVGQTLEVGGPKGSAVMSLDGIDSHVLIGDETAIPAIGRRLEELPAGARALVFVETDRGAMWPLFASQAELTTTRVQRNRETDAQHNALVAALRRTDLPKAGCFFWVGAETQVARAIRRHLVDERGIGKKWIKAAGYWQRGSAGAHERIPDEE